MIPHSRPTITTADRKNVLKVLESGMVTGGPVVEAFENAMAKAAGVKYAVAVNSGTSAIHLALLAFGIKKGDKVIIPDYVCTALLNCLNYVGAQPIIADCNPTNANLSLESVQRLMTKKIKAIIVPHMFGLAQDLAPFKRLGVPVIEDCAHTFGSKVNGNKIGSMGHVAVCSFYATKLLCAGEGGMLLTNSTAIRERTLDLREYDEKDDYQTRFNYRLTDIHAAMGLSQLNQLAWFIAKRRAIAARYSAEIKNPRVLPCGIVQNNIYFRYIVTYKGLAGEAIRRLNKNGISARRPIYKLLGDYMKKCPCPNSSNMYQHAVSIPIYPLLSQAETGKIIKAINTLL
ncbi:MAG: hypothetical protein A2248_07640 [Candidatus Raymondbacteria bacterium RIFOXYA2_FULL_49_16]|uniref:Aminotransferase DegT n=1 Tax=Candidatus Raymondbacteria bacterium RIFOXYD12_FULL_49_13 TaxID=1817890 RepID=A0A1F7F203_UNCRA|nr:MAG: hypothetical protein A2248_07640 [Candidatus Raymondbacteria bacterium RIFOXYA2_FULL_49_16]OGJ96140.1 MAG: hypothetical protein A2453_09495 [Candidatus Raymondbacteria bacterium RIFOXYC2_FULL_50_21]OGK00602.1 MAG: hypothetical protein A2519_21705 [Candidatus Raymondbacteria bacterium RIFOXYD12_FULL_49_13]OGP41147.1 MAG: hypothetical protein A2324_09890 [Candidatus Raymondbacteria bacterium RIFOXYB2_FULL_49_35]